MVDEVINDAVLKRGRVRAKLTRFETFLTNNSFEDEEKIENLKTRLNNVHPILGEFNEAQCTYEDLLEKAGKSDEEANEEVRLDFEERFYNLVSKANLLISKFYVSNKQASDADSSNGSTVGSTNLKVGVKLPEIKINEFSGGYAEWPQFFDSYKSLIHENSGLSDTEKFHYLIGLLKGDAAKTINSISITGDNYETALDILKKRYENKKAVVQSHVNSILFDLPNTKSNSHVALRNLLDSFVPHYRALKTLGENVEEWNALLICLILSKLDFKIKAEWDNFSKSKTDLKTIDLLDYLNEKCVLLESIDQSNFHYKSQNNKAVHLVNSTTGFDSKVQFSCNFCKGSHTIMFCQKFKALPINAKYDEIKRLKLCSNCLKKGHIVAQCRSGGCRTCNFKHNTLLHKNRENNFPKTEESVEKEINIPKNENAPIVAAVRKDSSEPMNIRTQVILSTVSLKIKNNKGNFVRCRALLDSGSQINLISSSLYESLGISSSKTQCPIVGINNISARSTRKLNLMIYSTTNNFSTNLPFYVIDKITDSSPIISLDSNNFKIPANIVLADDDFDKGFPIDLLLGAGVFYDLLCVGQIRLGRGSPILQKTRLGWIVGGNMPLQSTEQLSCMLTLSDIHNQVEKFWKIEEVPTSTELHYSVAERECEKLFVETTKRDSSGRFIVKLPIKTESPGLGNSLAIAIKRFNSLEKRLVKNETLYTQYREFMQEYEKLKHMSLLCDNISEFHKFDNNTNYFMSHHAVHKTDSTTTKTRVVFNASMPSTSGLSLNNVLHVGPVVQRDLFSILLKFRKHDVVLVGDLAKMYRQILVDKRQRPLQQIVWRSNPEEELKLYQLNTITYGTAPASFLSTRCLNQISLDIEKTYPIESQIIAEDFYVDDLLTGSGDANQLMIIGQNLIKILAEYGLPLRKFKSNNSSVLEYFKSSSGVGHDDAYIIDDTETSKTLGLTWRSSSDSFIFHSISPNHDADRWNKRLILSYTAQQFDPLGFLAPITISFKLFMQALWQAKLDWDESLTQRLQYQWIELLQQLEKIQEITIERQAYSKNSLWSQMHIFADASEQAYGSVIYIVSGNSFNGEVFSELLTSKSRVAPLKTITLPRLELCAAVLAARLGKKCAEILNIESENIFYYSDSTIVLAWLQRAPNTLATFVANRVGEIGQLTNLDHWYHVSSEENPADLITRGISFDRLQASEIWWRGPAFIKNINQLKKCDISLLNIDLPDQKKKVLKLIECPKTEFNLVNKFSSFVRLIHVTAYCRRFIGNLRAKVKRDKVVCDQNLSVSELEASIVCIVRLVQEEGFSDEFKALKNNTNILRASSLIGLDPFLDENMIIRVGGRLKHALISYESQHPILLPSGHNFTKLIIKYEHKRSLHAGVNATLAFVRQKFWPIHGKSNVKAVIRKCIFCYKVRPSLMSQQMGHLPVFRVSATRVFSNCGIDFAGPFNLKDGKTRNKKIIKGYMCLFICLWSKAVHIEAVTELSSEAFLATFRRFVSRRGIPSHIWSDNGTNFVGANAIINRTFCALLNSPEVGNFLGHNRIKWSFIPPRSPHFGGIWEAAIKSAKLLMKRTLQNETLHFEEFSTILCQVEASLNSRPVIPLPETPHDSMALTPGHFLIGDALTVLPEECLDNKPINYIKRFRMVQSLQQRFSRQWQKEYLHQLQERNKWKFKVNHPSLIGSVVLIKEDNYPPMQWSLGRIQEVHPSDDGLIRVVTLKTKNGFLKRAIHKLCLLPVLDEFENNQDEAVINSEG